MQLFIVIKSGQHQRILAMKNARANRTGAFGQMDGMATGTGCQEYATTIKVEYGGFEKGVQLPSSPSKSVVNKRLTQLSVQQRYFSPTTVQPVSFMKRS